MAAITGITITPVVATKTARIAGMASPGEIVTVTVKGCAAYIESELRVRIRRNGIDIARFPLEGTDAWAADGDDAVGELSLNTVQAFAAFAGASDGAKLDAVVIVEMVEASSRTLRVSGRLPLLNWPQANGDQPTDLTNWKDLVAAMQGEIDALEIEFGAHKHDGTDDSAQIAHGALTGITGTQTHQQIDTLIAALNASATTLATAMGAAQASIAAVEYFNHYHHHTGAADEGAKIDHKDLLDTTGIHTALSDRILAVGGRVTPLEASAVEAANDIDALQAEATKHVQKATADNSSVFTIGAMDEGPLREIEDLSDFYQLLRFVATLANDIKTRGVIR